MWEGSHTDLLFGKSMFIDMHDIDSPGKSAFCFTVNIHVVSGVAGDPRRSILGTDDAQHTRSGAKKRIIIISAFL